MCYHEDVRKWRWSSQKTELSSGVSSQFCQDGMCSCQPCRLESISRGWDWQDCFLSGVKSESSADNHYNQPNPERSLSTVYVFGEGNSFPDLDVFTVSTNFVFCFIHRKIVMLCPWLPLAALFFFYSLPCVYMVVWACLHSSHLSIQCSQPLQTHTYTHI